MLRQTIRSTFTFFVIVLVSATIALAQSPTSSGVITTTNTWRVAQLVGFSRDKLFIVTVDQPHRRQTCRIHSFTVDKLVCSRGIGGAHTYLPEQVVALILPGDDDLRLSLVIGFNGG